MTNTPSNEYLALAACPLCGADKPQHMYSETCQDLRHPRFNKSQSRIWCSSCGVTIIKDGIEEVRAAWNTRATSPAESAAPPAGGPVARRDLAKQIENFPHSVKWLNPEAKTLIVEALRAPQPQEPACREALENILQANDEFRASLPDGWEGDPLNDACIEARDVLAALAAGTTAGVDRGAQALHVVRQMVEAYDAGSLKMDSPEIGEPENDIPYHPWHEQLLHYARLAIEPGDGR